MNQSLYDAALDRLAKKRLGYRAPAKRDLDLYLQIPKEVLERLCADASHPFGNKHEGYAAQEALKLKE